MLLTQEINNIIIQKINSGIDINLIEEEFRISKKDINNLKNNYWRKQLLIVQTFILENKLDEALNIASKKEFFKVPGMISYHIQILKKLNKIDEILNLSLEKEFYDNPTIQVQIIKVLYQKKYIDEALKICSREAFKDSDMIKKIKYKILKNSELSEKIKIENNIKKENTVISDLLTKIYCGAISLEEINELQIEQFEKTLLMIAYYEKNNKKLGIKFVKEQKRLYINEKEKLKILNILLERLMSNKIIIFDIDTYRKYLKCELNFKLSSELFEKMKEENSVIEPVKKIENVDIITRKEVKEMKKDITSKNNLKIVNQQSSSNTIVVESKKKIVKEKINRPITIRNVFEKEVLQIGAYLYLKMQNSESRKTAVEAWDNLQLLIEKPISDEKALNKILNIFEAIKYDNRFNIKVDEKRYSKYKK